MVKEPAIMRRLDLRSTFRGWANSHEVPWINRDVLLWEVQAFTAKRLYPGAQGQPRFAASPWVHDVPRTHRASPRQRHTPAFAEPATTRGLPLSIRDAAYFGLGTRGCGS